MFKKLFAIFAVVLIIVLGLSLSPSLAKNDKDGDIPEQDGIYNVPGHPDMKVRVFVFKEKPAKPGKPSPIPTLYCPLDDPNSLALVGPTGWELPDNWTYYINPSSVPSSVGGANLAEITVKSFKVWTDVSHTSLIYGGTTSIYQKGYDGKSIIAWGRTSGSALAVTYTWYYPSTGMVAEVDTIMNLKFVWMWSGGTTECAYTNSYDAQNILTHELGHWFGLNDYYAADYKEATMYGYGSKMETKKNTLTTGDIDGVEAIY